MNFAKCSIGSRGLCLAIVLASQLTMTTRAQTVSQPAQPAQADNEYQTGAVLWQQSAAEARALQYQAYTLARLMLDKDFRIHGKLKRQRAVVVDVDETVLDNSRFQAALVIDRRAFSSAAWID